ncbi:hypothetical protein [Azospirillum palustre]
MNAARPPAAARSKGRQPIGRTATHLSRPDRRAGKEQRPKT